MTSQQSSSEAVRISLKWTGTRREVNQLLVRFALGGAFLQQPELILTAFGLNLDDVLHKFFGIFWLRKTL